MNLFIIHKKDNWQRLENLLELMEGTSLNKLSKLEVREFGELYRRAAADLAIARAETRDPKLINYLNSLVIRAHGKIYRAESQGVNLVWQFFTKDFPQTFRKTWGFSAVAFFLFTASFTISLLFCFYDSNFAEDLGVSQAGFMAQSNVKWWESLNDANQIGATQILTNNILVAFKAFVYGAIFGIGTVYVLIFNGFFIGGVVGTCYRVNAPFANDLVTFMIGHGVIELSCIFIAGGAGLLIGYSIINPGDLSRINSLKKSGIEAVRLAIGCASFLVIAGLIEGFLSPAGIPAPIKYGIGILTGILMYSYLVLVGREEPLNQPNI